MLHMKIDPAAAGRRAVVLVVAGAAACLDQLAFAAEGLSFLRAAWFEASADSSLFTLVARRRDGEAAAAIPLVARKPKAARLSEVPGSYWPFRSLPLAADCADAELQTLLSSPGLGRAWRWGPVPADDPALIRIGGLAAGCGWTVLRRRLATTYRVNLKRLTEDGAWPTTKTLRKNRWLERRLAEQGELEFATISGAAWDEAALDTLAAIEAESWVAEKGDAKFVDPAMRRVWTRALRDPALAAMLSCSVLRVGGVPAAFTFSVTSGKTRYYIANGYSARFAAGSPGRILLYRDFADAAGAEIEAIGWGAGDPGYKTEMGAEPGPELIDCLFVRGRMLGALARPFWARRG
jgi:CelD/BcsL family acetyltransferase involved in cellulose biosynthesis